MLTFMSDWIAAAAVVVALLGWWDNRRRIEASAIDLVIAPSVHPPEWHMWVLRNVGSRTVYHQSIDPASVSMYGLESNVGGFKLEPNEGSPFTLHPDPRNQFPDSVQVTFRKSVASRMQTRTVRFPAPARTAPSAGIGQS